MDNVLAISLTTNDCCYYYYKTMFGQKMFRR